MQRRRQRIVGIESLCRHGIHCRFTHGGQEACRGCMAGVVRVDGVDNIIRPFQAACRHFRPHRVAKTDHRQTVMLADFCLHLLVVASAFPHHEQKDDGGLIGLGKNLADQPFIGLAVRPIVVDREFYDDEIGRAGEQIPSRAQRAVHRTGAANAGIDQVDRAVGEPFPPPRQQKSRIAGGRTARDGSGRNRSADHAQFDRLPPARPGEHLCKTREVSGGELRSGDDIARQAIGRRCEDAGRGEQARAEHQRGGAARDEMPLRNLANVHPDPSVTLPVLHDPALCGLPATAVQCNGGRADRI